MSQVTAATPRLETFTALIVVIFSLLVLPAHAEGDKAQGFLWNVETQLGYDDNVYRTKDQEDSDGFVVLKPAFSWLGLYGSHEFDLSYQGDYAHYFNEDDLDYTDHDIRAHALLDHSARLRTDYTAGHQRGSDDSGSTDAISRPGEKPDKWRDDHIRLQIEYGSAASSGQLVGRARYSERRYTNNQQDYRDYDSTGGTGIFYYRVAPRTRLLFQADYDDYDYRKEDVFRADQGGDEYRLLTGVTWEATAKTTGVFKIGYRDRSYNDDRFDSQSGLALFLDGTWEPNSYTRVAFGAAVDNQDSAQQGSNGSVDTSAHIGMVRDITPRTRLKTDLRYVNEDFDEKPKREDTRWEYGLGIEYSLLHWLDIGAAYRFEDRDSDRDIFDFSSNVFLVTASTRFEP